MVSSDEREHAKKWRLRNSDGRLGFEQERLQDPPSFDLVESPIPISPAAKLTPDAGSTEAVAIRHVHVWDPTLEPPS
jgi:hypothetical protein